MNNTEIEKIYKVIYRALESFNQQLPSGRKLVPSPKCELVGSASLDSTEIVTLMVAIEQQIERDLGISVTLFDAVDQMVDIEALVKHLVKRTGGE